MPPVSAARRVGPRLRVGREEDLDARPAATRPSRCRGPRRRSRRRRWPSRCSSSSRLRTAGTTLTWETAALTSSVRIATPTSMPSTMIVGARGVGAGEDLGLLAAGGDRVGVGHVDALRAASTRSSRGTSPRCRGSAAPAARRRRARCWTCRTRTVPSTATTRSGGRSEGVSGTRAAYRWVCQPRDSRATCRSSARPLGDHQLHETDRTAGVVVDVDVLDVDPGLADVGEQPRQLAGVVGHRRRRPAGRADRAAVLAGDRAGAGDPAGQQLLRPPSRSPPRDGPLQHVELERGPRRAASCSASALSGHDLLPQRRVAAGDPGHVADALARRARGASAGASASWPATSTASRCGRWEVRATAWSCSSGLIVHRDGAADPGQLLDQRHRVGPWPARPASPPTGGRRTARAVAASGPDRSLPAIGWPPT